MSLPTPFARRLLFGLVALLSAGVAIALVLRGAQAPTGRHVTLYYGDPQAMYLVPVRAAADWPAEPEAAARAIAEKLSRPPDRELVALLPPGARLLEARLQPPTWSLRLALPGAAGSNAERLMVGALVRSLVESYPEARQAEVRLVSPDNQPYESQHLDLSTPLTPADFANRAGGASDGLSATVWWRAHGLSKLVPVDVPLGRGSGSPVRDALAHLAEGPPSATAAFLSPVAPAGLGLSFSGLEGGVARVDVSRVLPEGADGARLVEAVVLTLTAHEGIEAVRFERDGLPMPQQVGPYALGEPVQRPATVNTPEPEAP